jgi:hypothetical protein
MDKYETPVKIRLQLDGNSPFGAKAIIEDNGFGSDESLMPTTLKDVSIILWRLCGGGVADTLSRELSETLDIPFVVIDSAMTKIIEKYCYMDEEEAYLKTFPENFVEKNNE